MAYCKHCLVVRARGTEMQRGCVHCPWVQREWDETQLTEQQCAERAALSQSVHREKCVRTHTPEDWRVTYEAVRWGVPSSRP